MLSTPITVVVDELEQFSISHRAEIDGALRISGNSGNLNLAQSGSDSIHSSSVTPIAVMSVDPHSWPDVPECNRRGNDIEGTTLNDIEGNDIEGVRTI